VLAAATPQRNSQKTVTEVPVGSAFWLSAERSRFWLPIDRLDRKVRATGDFPES